MKKDIINKEILKHITRDVSKHILHIDINDDMELIDKEFTRIETRNIVVNTILKRLKEQSDDREYENYLRKEKEKQK